MKPVAEYSRGPYVQTLSDMEKRGLRVDKVTFEQLREASQGNKADVCGARAIRALEPYLRTTDILHPSYEDDETMHGNVFIRTPALNLFPARYAGMFIPHIGYRFLVVDYPQMEIRFLMWAAQIGDIHRAEKIYDIINRAAGSFHAKCILMGIVCGRSMEDIAKRTGLDKDTIVQDWMRIRSAYPILASWMDMLTGFMVKRRQGASIDGQLIMLKTQGTTMRITDNEIRKGVRMVLMGSVKDLLVRKQVELSQKIVEWNLDAFLVCRLFNTFVIEVGENDFDEQAARIENLMKEPFGDFTIPMFPTFETPENLMCNSYPGTPIPFN